MTKTQVCTLDETAMVPRQPNLPMVIVPTELDYDDEDSVYYFLVDDVIKIGHGNVDRRRRAFQTSHVNPVIVLAIEPGGAEVEAERHRAFACFRVRQDRHAAGGELFRPDPALLFAIEMIRENQERGLEDAKRALSEAEEALGWMKDMDNLRRSALDGKEKWRALAESLHAQLVRAVGWIDASAKA
jgi:hypothetical protein